MHASCANPLSLPAAQWDMICRAHGASQRVSRCEYDATDFGAEPASGRSRLIRDTLPRQGRRGFSRAGRAPTNDPVAAKASDS